MDGDLNIIQDFGIWNQSQDGYHLAKDAPQPGGTKVYSTANGVVKFARTDIEGYGGIIIIEQNMGSEIVTSLYGHLSKRRGLQVSETSPVVTRGQLIAYIADDDEDGGDWGPHLHFGIRKGAYTTGTIGASLKPPPPSRIHPPIILPTPVNGAITAGTAGAEILSVPRTTGNYKAYSR